METYKPTWQLITSSVANLVIKSIQKKCNTFKKFFVKHNDKNKKKGMESVTYFSTRDL